MKVRLFDTYTEVYNRIKRFKTDKSCDKIFLQGGTESSKTISILQLLCLIAIKPPRPLRRKRQTITVFGEDLPNLKVGAIRDFQTLIEWSPLLRRMLLNPDSQSGIFKFKNGTIFEFRSYDSAQDAQSGKRDWAYAYECKGIPHEIFTEIESRTDHVTFACFNPTAKFWAHKMYEGNKDVFWDISTYVDNPYASPKAVRKILGYKKKWEDSIVTDAKGVVVSENNHWKNKWYVHGLGHTGVVEGVIYPDINWVSNLPPNMKREAYAMDFGYNDPTTLIKAGIKFGNINAKELMYERGLTDLGVVRHLESMGFPKKQPIITENADPKAIATLQNHGYQIFPVHKPRRKINMIKLVKSYNINITSDSLNWKEEQENYSFKKFNGEYTDIPKDGHDHLWDTLGYYCLAALSPLTQPRKRPSRTSARRRLVRL